MVLAAVAVAAAGTLSRGSLQAAAALPDSTSVLDLRLTAWAGLPGLSKRALAVEAESIWRESHVRLRWLAGNDQPGGMSLRVLVTPEAVATRDSPPQWTVGELLRFDQTTAIAVASVAGARRIVDESQRFRLIDLPAHRDYRLGIVLGRAIAHEIGHYLLRTNTHAPSGLMRATFGAQEFADLGSKTFHLDRAATAHLQATTRQRRLASTLPDEPFSY